MKIVRLPASKKNDKKKKDLLHLIGQFGNHNDTKALTQPTNYLRGFAQAACTGIEASAPCTEIFYAGCMDHDGKKICPQESWVLLSFAYLVQNYAGCCLSSSESNMAKCYAQFKVCSSYADYHLRYKLLLSQVPMDIANQCASASQHIKDSQERAAASASDLGKKSW